MSKFYLCPTKFVFIDASSDDLRMTFHGYKRVDSDPALSDNPHTALLQGNDDYGWVQ
uniref:F5/8 type C domain-containing protein n=1 Tax=Heterorhabditis bacteriophora TaxID=37862 RepID=A0A1I7WXZ5_HETBA